jgi:hypothetical protein
MTLKNAVVAGLDGVVLTIGEKAPDPETSTSRSRCYCERIRGTAVSRKDDETAKEFRTVPNIPPARLEKWLETDESKRVG